jgi:hypothetical protein
MEHVQEEIIDALKRGAGATPPMVYSPQYGGWSRLNRFPSLWFAFVEPGVNPFRRFDLEETDAPEWKCRVCGGTSPGCWFSPGFSPNTSVAVCTSCEPHVFREHGVVRERLPPRLYSTRFLYRLAPAFSEGILLVTKGTMVVRGPRCVWLEIARPERSEPIGAQLEVREPGWRASIGWMGVLCGSRGGNDRGVLGRL